MPAPDADAAVTFSHVSFGYRRRRDVFSDFRVSFASGTTVVLGPNGSGKSTLFALGASALLPRRGRIEIPGVADARRQRRVYRSHVSWMPQDQQAVPGLNAREQVAYAGWLKGLSKSTAWERSEQALARVDLAKSATTPAQHLSGGQKRRLALAQALVHDARVLLLDEPTAGLDPVQRKSFRDTVREALAGRAVIVSTHDTQDIGGMFERVVVLVGGHVIWDGTTTDFLRLAAHDDNDARRAEEAYGVVVGNAGLLRE